MHSSLTPDYFSSGIIPESSLGPLAAGESTFPFAWADQRLQFPKLLSIRANIFSTGYSWTHQKINHWQYYDTSFLEKWLWQSRTNIILRTLCGRGIYPLPRPTLTWKIFDMYFTMISWIIKYYITTLINSIVSLQYYMHHYYQACLIHKNSSVHPWKVVSGVQMNNDLSGSWCYMKRPLLHDS